MRRAAYQLFMKQGYTATTYKQIAEAIGKERTTVQGFFPQKVLLATDFLNDLAIGCETFARERGLLAAEPVSSLLSIGQLYFAFLLKDSGMRRFTFDIISDRAITGESLSRNQSWVDAFLAEEAVDVAQSMRSFVLAMGGGYDLLYQAMKSGIAIDGCELTRMIVTAFLANVDGMAPLDAESGVRLDATTLREGTDFLLAWMLR